MKITRYLVLVLFVFVGTVASAHDRLKENIEGAIARFAKDHKIQAIYAVAEDNKIILNGAHGFFDFKENERLTVSQVMPIASITKQMTGVAILLLQDKGLLSVQDTIAKIFPAKSGLWENDRVPEWAHQVTIHHLLTHSSGVSEYLFTFKIDQKKSHEQINKDIISHIAEKKLEFTPGRKYQYSNTGYVLLGMIIEQRTGKQLASFFKKELFDPLGMKRTKMMSLGEALKVQNNLISNKYATRYYAIPSSTTPKLVPVGQEIIAAPNADGGVVSTVEDLIKWSAALHHGKILSKTSYQQMVRPYLKVSSDDSEGFTSHIGYGIYISKLRDGKIYYHHEGRALGIRGDVGYIPHDDVSMAILSNIMVHVPKEMRGKVDFRKPENQVDIAYFRNSLLEAM